MKKTNGFSLSELLEKGHAEYLGLFLIFAGGGWMLLAVLDACGVGPFKHTLFNAVAAIIVCALLAIYLFIGIKSVHVMRMIRNHYKETTKQQQKT
ncbi:hypothetical protein NEAUS03_0399 [Nematocida ausubeli]|nr:hypothetical protein NEAUS03_0399 [Nematocida ausubeli]